MAEGEEQRAPALARLRGIVKVIRTRSAAAHTIAVLITIYAALLRLDAFTGKYGTVERPAWARFMTHRVAPIAASLRPSGVHWYREARPYVGGDPINYLAYAREMQSFYQAHVREPVFLALTRASLWTLGNQDVGVGLASAIGSTLAVFATYLVGRAVVSPAVGLIAALLLAIEYDAITWAPDGWRDDTFTAATLFAAWALFRLRRDPSAKEAALAGVFGGIACLTRVTAVTFIIPALCWIVLDGDAQQRWRRVKCSVLALLVAAIVTAPYLINCAIQKGDPLLAINYHTSYYRFAEGRPIGEPMSAAEYIRSKFAARPVATLDIAMNGLLVRPFVTKWRGFRPWMTGLETALQTCALAGIAALPFFASGRLLLIILLTSLVPYIFTWNLGGGGEWRFMMHVYPLYLMAAAAAITGAVQAARAMARDPSILKSARATFVARRAAIVAAIATVGVLLYFGFPWFVVRESIALGDSTSVETGERDQVFFRRGWSRHHEEGITVRVSEGQRSTVSIPLLASRNYDLVLRIDPVAPAMQERVNVLFNGHFVAALRLGWNPERVGSYRISLREGAVKAGSNELALLPETLVPASAAGPRFAWLNPDDRLGVRLWYVRVLPMP